METRKIEVEGKVNRRRVEKIIKKDKKMIGKAIEIEKYVIRDLKRALIATEGLVEVGLLTVDEGVELNINIKKALSVFEKRDGEEAAKRVADFGAKRVAETVGGKVLEGGEENAEG